MLAQTCQEQLYARSAHLEGGLAGVHLTGQLIGRRDARDRWAQPVREQVGLVQCRPRGQEHHNEGECGHEPDAARAQAHSVSHPGFKWDGLSLCCGSWRSLCCSFDPYTAAIIHFFDFHMKWMPRALQFMAMCFKMRSTSRDGMTPAPTCRSGQGGPTMRPTGQSIGRCVNPPRGGFFYGWPTSRAGGICSRLQPPPVRQCC